MSFPTAEDARRLHARLLEGDPVAPPDVCSAFLGPLLAHLRARLPRLDPHLLQSAAHQTLLDFVKRPDRYDPARHADPGAYLRLSARADALNLLKSDSRRQRRREVVELDSLPGNSSGDDGPALRLIRDEDDAERGRVLQEVERECDAADRRVLRLIVAGVKPLAAFAAALGVADRPIEEQKRLVKQAKDRVMKRLRRFKRHA